MSWFKVDDSFPAHPKLEELGDGVEHALAVAAWVLLGADSMARGTDGIVSQQRLRRVLPWSPKLIQTAVDALVRVGLWEVDGVHGWRYHDWHDYQPTSEEVERSRRDTRDRQRKWKAAKRAERAAGNALPNALLTRRGNADGNDPSRPVPSRPVSGSFGTTESVATTRLGVLVSEYAKRSKAAGCIWPGLGNQHSKAVVVADAFGDDVDALTASLDAFFADSYARSAGFDFALWVRNPTRWKLAGPAKASDDVATPITDELFYR